MGDKQIADIQAAAESPAHTDGAAPESAEGEAIAQGNGAAAAAGAEPEDISMEDVLGTGTRKRPSAVAEDLDELQAETRRS